jgi:hypothetical protein
MTSCPKSAPVGSTPPSGRGLNAAERPPVRVTAAAPDGLQDPRAIRGTPKERAGGVGHPAAPSAPRPVPDHSGAEGGLREPSPQAPARAAAAVPERGGRGSTPSPQGREGTAGPGVPMPGPASTSPPAPEGAAGGAREEEAGVRTLRAGLSPAKEPAGGTRPAGSSTSPPAAPLRGKAFRDAVKAAESAQARDKRIARGKWPAKRAGSAYGPGMTRRLPPGSGGAA